MTDRDQYIDNVKGLCVLSVVFIHTVFWSGDYYAPDYLRTASLFFDVGIFFFLAGATLFKTGRINPLKQISKLSLYFTGLVVFFQVVTLQPNLKDVVSALVLNSAVVPDFVVVNGSYWFVPMYSVALMVAYTIIKHMKWLMVPFVAASGAYYVYAYYTGYSVPLVLFGVGLPSALFYVSLVILGYGAYRYRGSNWWLLSLAFFSLVTLWFMLGIPNFSMQKFKFPVGLPYVTATMISLSLILFVSTSRYSRALSFLGRNSIFFYMSQGIGASVLLKLTFMNAHAWWVKLPVFLAINLAVSIIVGCLFLWATFVPPAIYGKLKLYLPMKRQETRPADGQ